MTQSQISQNKGVTDGYVVPSESNQKASSKACLFDDPITDDSKVEFKFASITQKVIEKIAESQKNLISASSANLNSDTR